MGEKTTGLGYLIYARKKKGRIPYTKPSKFVKTKSKRNKTMRDLREKGYKNVYYVKVTKW